MKITLPEILNIPKKLLPFILKINEFKYFLGHGGRGSAKTHSVARILLYLAEQETLRIFCGREIQSTIEDSVYTVLVDYIKKFNLNYTIGKTVLTHNVTGTTFKFKGFREQGNVNIKGLEGVQILWIDESESITTETLKIIIPTIRKNKAKIFFTMNRKFRNDPVFERFAKRENCLCIEINYTDNEFCPQTLIDEALECKNRNESEYNHIWLNQPIDVSDDYLYNYGKLDQMSKIRCQDQSDIFNVSVLAIDFSGNGGDLCVAKHVVQRNNLIWEEKEQVVWSDPDTDLSVGKAISLYNELKPSIMIVDANGLGYPMYVSIKKVISGVIGFKGSENKKCGNISHNHRAEAAIVLKEFIDNERWMSNCQYTKRELETIKKKFQKSTGKLILEDKVDMKKKGIDSPDRFDSSCMAAFAIRYYMTNALLAGKTDRRKSALARDIKNRYRIRR